MEKKTRTQKISQIANINNSINDAVFTIYENEEDEIGQKLNLKTGHYYYIDVTKPHSVSNNSNVDRYHLVVDCFMDSQLSAIL